MVTRVVAVQINQFLQIHKTDMQYMLIPEDLGQVFYELQLRNQ